MAINFLFFLPARMMTRLGSRKFTLATAAIFALFLLPATSGFQLAVAQTASPNALVSAPSKPLWTELNPSQQQALKPLEQNWTTINEDQKRKWLELSKNFSALSADDSATVHSRMKEWVALSPQQRAAARLNFGKTQEIARELTADEKKAKWEQYQALSPEEKQRLATTGNARPAGAAAAIKPVEVQKLAPVAPASIPTVPKSLP